MFYIWKQQQQQFALYMNAFIGTWYYQYLMSNQFVLFVYTITQHHKTIKCISSFKLNCYLVRKQVTKNHCFGFSQIGWNSQINTQLQMAERHPSPFMVAHFREIGNLGWYSLLTQSTNEDRVLSSIQVQLSPDCSKPIQTWVSEIKKNTLTL